MISYSLCWCCVCGSFSASWHMVSLHFACSMHSSGLSFQQECLLLGLLSNCSIALFIISWNSLMNSSLSALQLTSDELSSSSDSSWSLLWSWGGSSATSCCHTLPVQLLDSPVTLHLSVDRCHGTRSHVFGGISSTLLSSITVPVMSQTLCVPGVPPVGFLTVLTSLPNVVASPVSQIKHFWSLSRTEYPAASQCVREIRMNVGLGKYNTSFNMMSVDVFPLCILIFMLPIPVAWNVVLSAAFITCNEISLKVVNQCQLGDIWPDAPKS